MKLFFFSNAICSEGSCVTFTTSLRNLTAAVVKTWSFGREHLPSSSTRHLFLHTSTCTGFSLTTVTIRSRKCVQRIVLAVCFLSSSFPCGTETYMHYSEIAVMQNNLLLVLPKRKGNAASASCSHSLLLVRDVPFGFY